MKARRVTSFLVAVVYGVFSSLTAVLADSEFDGGGGGSDGAWGWNPPNHDRFGSNDGIAFGGGNLGGADDYGSGGGGPFGGGNGGALAGQMGLLAFLISLISGNNGLTGLQRDRAGSSIANLMMAASKDGGSGASNPNNNNSPRVPPGRIESPDGDFFDAP